MKTLVHFGAPKNILINGKPHLGTDRLVPLLRNFRQHLQRLGVSTESSLFYQKLVIDYVYLLEFFTLLTHNTILYLILLLTLAFSTSLGFYKVWHKGR